MLCLHLDSYMASDSTWKPTSSALWRYYCSGLKGCLLEDLTSGNRTLHHVTQIEESSLGCEKISATASLLTLPDYPDCNPRNNACCVVELENNKIPYFTKDELKTSITAAFSNLNKDTIRKVCRRFQSSLEVMVEANDNIFW